ncbi:hypothetical protein [Pelomonas sp. SE-A7]|uniref:BPSS1187 family protein n=1 Tax=Pelomonas sp. SE-A7 TaxID=3054953 RepID=UPI00259C99F4|nr:hypothetical protein [Pelomonas sp. SE-A7]MDM4766103.1 hypothetical protein [Pelomonas sp. SE-A7]
MKKRSLTLLALALAAAASWAEPQRLLIDPHATDARLAAGEAPHLVVYGAVQAAQANAPLIVWLPGTNGRPAPGPRQLFETWLEQGYRLVGLSYLNHQAVSQICVPARLRSKPGCAAEMRQQRVWGDISTGLIGDRPEDAIVPRLTALLQYLVRSDAAGRWDQYLDAQGQPRWERLVLAGQSQGGGMAAYLAQSRAVAGVIMFSGGWDHGRDGDIAPWYGRSSATPAERWWGTYHVEEEQGSTMARIYHRLGVPATQIKALKEPVREGGRAHGEGIANPVYKPLWQQMLPVVR